MNPVFFIQKTRRGVHSLIAVSMLIGFTLVGATILSAILVDYRDISLNSADCYSDVSLYGVGENRAYLVVSLRNLGSEIMTSANIMFVDDFGLSHGFANDSLEISPGQTWKKMDSFSASVSPDTKYVIRILATMHDGSMIDCSTVHMSRS